MSGKKGMKRRTRITLAVAALTTFAFAGTYGLVAHQGVPLPSTTSAATTQPGTTQNNQTTAQNQNSGTNAQNSASSSQPATPPVIHARTRAS